MSTVDTAPPPTMDCGAMTANDGSNCGESQDCGEARMTDVDNNPRRGRLTPLTAAMGGGCRRNDGNGNNEQMNIGVGIDDGGGGDNNDRESPLTQEAEDCGAKLQVAPREFG